MSILKNIRLGLLHVAVAITFVLINGVLNRVMINDMGILATVVAALVVLPYLLSPLQVWIGQYSDTHPFWGYRRTPYIALGMLLCVGGALMTPHAALTMQDAQGHLTLAGVGLGVLAFGCWGLGYNLAVVAYLALASDLAGETQRSRTIAVMWFMMIMGLIITGIAVSRALEQYSDARLVQVFDLAGLAALVLAAVSLAGLEPRHTAVGPARPRESQLAALRLVAANPQARLFFIYLTLLLAAILGQDVLLEPYGAQAFGMSQGATARLTPIWGGMTLLALLLYGFGLSRRMSKKQGALLGGVIVAVGLLLIALSGPLGQLSLFLPGVAILGFGTGIATATNLSLMLDMTVPGQAGLFIGAWGLADAISRGIGTLLGGVMLDAVRGLTGNATGGYVSVFVTETVMLCVALLLLRSLDIGAFRARQSSLMELVAVHAEVGG